MIFIYFFVRNKRELSFSLDREPVQILRDEKKSPLNIHFYLNSRYDTSGTFSWLRVEADHSCNFGLLALKVLSCILGVAALVEGDLFFLASFF